MAMDSFLHLVIAALLLICGSNGRVIDDLDNSIQNVDAQLALERQDWVKISEAPPSKIVHPIGTTIELECEATGSPPPIIHWVRGNNPKNSINNFESNMIVESSPNALVRVRSRLIIDHVLPSERSFTCVGRSGGKTAYATTTVYGAGNSQLKSHNITELLGLNSNLLDGTKKARIVLYYSVIFEMIGSNVILPCSVAGRPYPEIYWMDTEDHVINNDEPGLRVLPSGELLISELKWSDMGSYTCIARNPLSKDSISTFVYPVLNE